ncbi:ATP-binding cassette-type vacuolar membrane transporter Hmt1 [Coniosporium apollinis]|uniref:ATP-binding cassette-type vacuolar membrane transporter Hmt1 n=1 Tax=Coniosporium apollinis TaxID=61459 RepID=A0ABQ9NZ28_9PEZI|nr:ATP-binding cassette-type vacuolar membrane transporter Hmt1 [Coniosporium apollinis]
MAERTLVTEASMDDVRPGYDSGLAASTAPHRILRTLHYAYPIVLLLFFLCAFTLQSIRASSKRNSNGNGAPDQQLGPGGKPLPNLDPTRNAPKKPKHDDISRPRKLVFEWMSVVLALTFIGNTINVIVHALYDREEQWWCGQAMVIYLVGSFFVYSLFVISLLDTKPSPTAAHLATWIFATLMEIVILGASFALYTTRHREPRAGKGRWGKLRGNATEWEITELALDLFRILLLLFLIGFYVLFVASNGRKKEESTANGPSESTGLLAESRAENGHAVAYGSAPAGGKHKHTEGAPAGWSRPDGVPSRSWWEYIKGYSVFFPYLWPSKDRRLQIVVVICFTIVVFQRVVNVLVPYQVGKITDDLSGENGQVKMPWGAICLYIFYRLLQGSNGLLGALRSTLWIPIGQYSYRELSVAAFEHVHGLSLDFHLGKKTGEVLSALGKGSSINTFLEQVTFQVVPMLVDLCVAIAYFLIAFDAYYALVVAVVTFWYVYLTIRMAQWRAEIRRQMVNADREEDAVKYVTVDVRLILANNFGRNDSMVSYETVKYFNAEAYEFNRYRNAVMKYQKAEYLVLFSLNIMNVTQNLVFMLGLMVACFVAAYQVTTGVRKVGNFVTLLTYMAQLQGPLNFFGTFYRMIQSAMINSERMLELFKEQPTVVDQPHAKELPSCEGEIRFNDVHFAYDARKPALNGLDFRCPPGTTTALVGESGGGKSTVFRLLFRFYNIQAGSIQVDGHYVEDVTIDSLRRHIGVVPQDTVLFNETVMYNLRYANPNATDEQVYEACRAASIHDKILSFPDGYETKVGERGLRLSGGEKQRVAIARTILKNPRIIMLDEATAALDTETEQHIQEALTTLSQGRTMLVIAHRLSTIVRADQILVLHEGRVAERGSHEELLAKKGRYASMWKKQVKAQRAAEEAKALNDKAQRLRRESQDGAATSGGSGEGSASSSEDEKDREKGKAIEKLAADEAGKAGGGKT